jgi:hypothetical protein
VIWSAQTRAGLIALFARLLELPATAVHWRAEPRPVVVGVSATIDEIGTETPIGVDEVVYQEGPTAEAPTETTPTVYGLRETSIQVSVWSPSQQLEQSARSYTSRLMTRMAWPSATEELRQLGLGLVGVGASLAVDVEQSSRMRSGSAVEIRLSFGSAEADAAVPFIEHARFYTTGDAPNTGDIRNAGGTSLRDPAQADAWAPPLPPEP